MGQFGKNIQSVQRAIDILNCFQSEGAALSLGEISAQVSLNKSTAHGIINTLRNNDYLRQADNGDYMLSAGLLAKFQFFQQSHQAILREFSEQYMVALANKYTASAKLFSLSQGVPSLVHKVSSPTVKYELTSDFATDPLYCSATGKLLLAEMSSERLDDYLDKHPLVAISPYTITNKEKLKEHLAIVKETRVSIENQELGESISAIATPVFYKGTLVASISILDTTTHMARFADELREDMKNLGEIVTKKLDDVL